MKQFTREEAIAFSEAKFWERMTPQERAVFQLSQKCLCMPFDVFQLSVDELLGRPTWTHEYARPQNLIAEANGLRDRPTMADILAQLPVEKLVVLNIGA